MAENSRIFSLVWGFSGGVARYAAMMSTLDQRPGIDFQTAVINCRKWACNRDDLEAYGLDEITIRGRWDFSWIGPCVEKINRFDPDLLFVHGGFVESGIVWILQRKLKRNIPYVASNHGYATNPWKLVLPIRERLAPLNPLTYQHRALAVVTVAHACKENLVAHGVSPEKITVVHNGIDPEPPRVDPVSRSSLGIKENETIIGVLSRLTRLKGVSYLINALRTILKTHPTVHLVVAGDGSEANQLKRLARNTGIDSNVHFVGYQTNAQAWLELFDIYALPSLAEFHSIALLEAMRAQKPIVATDVGGNTESVRHGKEALIVPPKNADAIAEAINQLIEDHALADTLAKSAKKRFLSDFTIDRMLSETESWLYDCGRLAQSK